MLNQEIANDENLFRVIRPWKRFWKKKSGHISAAAFKDEKGLSVDRDGGRNNEQIANEFFIVRGFEGSLVKGNCGAIRDIEVFPFAEPTIDNPFHALLQESETIVEISDDKCELLTKVFSVLSKNTE